MQKPEKFKCDICGKEFNSLRSLKSHIGHHVRKGDVESFRGSKSDSIKETFHYFSEDGNRVYKCKCGREFTNKQSYASHCGHCEINLGYKPKRRGSNIQDWWSELKKSNPDECHGLHVKAGLEGSKKQLEKNGDYAILIYSRTPSEKKNEAHRKQSETRKRKYLTGELTPAEIANTFRCSYMNGMFIRSSYETVYFMFLEINSFEYEYETIRVPDMNGSTHISDFKMDDGTIVEVKGNTKEIPEIREAFESQGYSIRFVTSKEINQIKEYLRGIVQIDKLLEIIDKEKKNNNLVYWKLDKDLNILYSVYPKDNRPNKDSIVYSEILLSIKDDNW